MDIILKLVMKGKDCRVSRMIMKKNKARKIIKPYYAVLCLVAQLCLTLCDHMDYTVHGILQARILEWVAVPFSRGSSQPRG